MDASNGWALAATVASTTDPRSEQLDNRISELDGEINALMSAFESQLSRWASRREDFWPLEPQGGRYLAKADAAGGEEGWDGASEFQDALNEILTDMTEAGPWMDTLERQWEHHTAARHRASLAAQTIAQPPTVAESASSRAPDRAKQQRRISTLNAGIARMKQDLEDATVVVSGLKDQITDLKAKSPEAPEPSDQRSVEPVHMDTAEGADDLQRPTAMLVDLLEEEMARDRPAVKEMLEKQRVSMSTIIERVSVPSHLKSMIPPRLNFSFFENLSSERRRLSRTLPWRHSKSWSSKSWTSYHHRANRQEMKQSPLLLAISRKN